MTDEPIQISMIEHAASRAESDPFFLAGALRAYQRAERMDDKELVSWLGCSLAELPRLALCRRPGALFPVESLLYEAQFVDDVNVISERFGIRKERLAGLLRQVAFLNTAVHGVAVEETLLLAAHDRETDLDPTEDETDRANEERQ